MIAGEVPFLQQRHAGAVASEVGGQGAVEVAHLEVPLLGMHESTQVPGRGPLRPRQGEMDVSDPALPRDAIIACRGKEGVGCEGRQEATILVGCGCCG